MLMGAALYWAVIPLAPLLQGNSLERIAGLSALIVGGMVLFAALAQISGATNWRDLKSLRRSGNAA
jgi:putative peptidoglycan lipid II flippase